MWGSNSLARKRPQKDTSLDLSDRNSRDRKVKSKGAKSCSRQAFCENGIWIP